jgi:thiamine kinase-like enzyme
MQSVLNQFCESPCDEALELAKKMFLFVGGETETDAFACIAIACSKYSSSVFEDYLYNKECIVIPRIVEILPSVVHLLHSEYKLREVLSRPEKYYTKTQSLSDAAIREFCIYTGFETEVEFYGYAFDGQNLHLYLESGDKDLATLLHEGKVHRNAYEVLVESKEPTGLLDVETREALYVQMRDSVKWLQSNKLVHGDLKPLNWIVCNNKLKLIDFG